MSSNEPDPRVPDPLDQYLAALPLPPSPAELQEHILAKTSRVIRHRRWSRRLAVAAGMAACYVAGGLAVWPATRHLDLTRHADVSTSAPIAAAPRPLPQPSPTRYTPTVSPVQLEWQALDQGHGGADLYRQA